MHSWEERPVLPNSNIEEDPRQPFDNRKPVFFGHYWMTGAPVLQTPKIVCVDYSAGKDGPLMAYRWDGEMTLTEKNFSCA